MGNKKKDESIWDDCGCPLSMAIGSSIQDVSAITSLPHMCTISSAEFTKHYVVDRLTYEKLSSAPLGSPLALWTQKRCQENRMFVSRPPIRPIPPPEPWRYDEPPLEWELPPGWRAWVPSNPKFVFGEDNLVEDYEMALDSFFLYMNIKDPVKQGQMRGSMEAWTVACDQADVLVKGKHPSRNDRCFVTSHMELFMYLFFEGNRLKHYLKDFKIRGPIRCLRRFVDIAIDARVKTGGCGHTFIP